LTTFRDTPNSRQIALMALPCLKNARRIFAIVSTTSIPTSASKNHGSQCGPSVPGSRLEADHPEKGVLFACRSTVLGEEFSATQIELAKQLGKIAALELKLAELPGAVDVLRGREPPPPAKFPRVKAWKEDTVYHEGDVVAFAGGTYQARRDTASPPGAKGWVCLATAGRRLTVSGTYNGDIDYSCLDVAMSHGSSVVALKDSPGACPGDDWQLLCSRGSRGFKGERGFIGPRGERAPIIKSWQIDRATYSAIPILADGSAGPALELRALFKQFLSEREASGI